MNDGESSFFEGQRVIYGGCSIVLTIPEPEDSYCRRNGDSRQWVRDVNGIDRYVDTVNLKPLPGGQL